MCRVFFFFVKQKTAYEMRISDWSSDVCSSDLAGMRAANAGARCRRRTAVFDHDIQLAPILARRDRDPGVTGTDRSGTMLDGILDRSEERRVGKECVSTCRSRWSPYN